MSADNPYLALAYRRALTTQNPALVQVSFDSAVLEKYRAPGYSLIRTNTVGRVTRQGGWTLDLGIGEEGRTVHACVGDLLNNLPDAEREHWAQHVVSLPLSANFLAMRLQPNSCFDDGEVRPWD
jgi:hypothetical protein